jgi:DNA-binding transcriptional MerR regulator
LKAKKSQVPVLPDKRYFRIGEVSKLAGLPSHTLRYWETEFKFLQPQKAGTGQRMYNKSDVEFIFVIKNLLHDQRFTIEGARQHLREMKSGRKDAPGPEEKGKPKGKASGQLNLGFEENILKDKIKKTVKELRAIEKSLRAE